MKAIAVFSGKGGVGKSTVAALLALALSKNHKVALLDMDINTPSIPVLFGERRDLRNLSLFSTGFGFKGFLGFAGGSARQALKDLAKEVKSSKPDICIIDMPPGASDSHFEICGRLKPSASILVIQPNELCKEDAERVCCIVAQSGIPIIGVVENMVGPIFGESGAIGVAGLKLIASIPLIQEISSKGNSGKIDELQSNPLDNIAEKIYARAKDINWSLEIEQGLQEDLKGPSITEVLPLIRLEDRKTWKFYGTQTWEQLRELYMEKLYDGFIIHPELCLEDNTTKRISETINNISSDGTGMFMIIKTYTGFEVPLFPAEIGTGRLIRPESYYGIPRIAYQTDQGEPQLFPSEIKPVDSLALQEKVAKGLLVPTKTNPVRYLPSPKELEGILEGFGDITHAGRYKKEYKRLGCI
jgi:MinD superfamily P-loop ATPase